MFIYYGHLLHRLIMKKKHLLHKNQPPGCKMAAKCYNSLDTNFRGPLIRTTKDYAVARFFHGRSRENNDWQDVSNNTENSKSAQKHSTYYFFTSFFRISSYWCIGTCKTSTFFWLLLKNDEIKMKMNVKKNLIVFLKI